MPNNQQQGNQAGAQSGSKGSGSTHESGMKGTGLGGSQSGMKEPHKSQFDKEGTGSTQGEKSKQGSQFDENE